MKYFRRFGVKLLIANNTLLMHVLRNIPITPSVIGLSIAIDLDAKRRKNEDGKI